jgi:hypothetical protein
VEYTGNKINQKTTIRNHFAMCQSLIRLSELRREFPGQLFLHGILRKGGEEDNIPTNATFADRINRAIQDSNETKLSTHSFALGMNGRDHLWSPYGIILSNGDVIAADREDTGLRKDTLHLIEWLPTPIWSDVLDPNRPRYNELVVQHAGPIGIFIWWKCDGQFLPSDIHAASLRLKLPVYILTERELFRTQWNDETGKFDILRADPVNLDDLFIDPVNGLTGR